MKNLHVTRNLAVKFDLFTIICQYECSEFKIGKGNEHETSRTLGLRCARINILSLTHVFCSDGDLNKSKFEIE